MQKYILPILAGYLFLCDFILSVVGSFVNKIDAKILWEIYKYLNYRIL